MNELTKENLDDCGWIDISIPDEEKDILVLIMNDPIKTIKMSTYLKEVYRVRCQLIDNNRCRVSITFKNAIRVNLITEKNLTNYPPIKTIIEGRIHRIAAGMWENSNQVRVVGHIQQLPENHRLN